MSARTLPVAIGLAAAIAVTSACSSPGAEPGASVSGTASPIATVSPTASATASTGTGGTDGTLPADLRTRPEVAAAIADTAARAKVSPEQVLIAAWSPVTWNDGSLGCPQEGMAYTQALVDGELLMLRVEQSLFQYHSGSGGPFAYCAEPDASYTVTS